MADENVQQPQQQSSGGNTNAGGDWRTSIPEDIRSHESLKDIKDVAGLAKSFVNQQPLLGRDKLVLPTDKSAPEEWDSFFTKLGRPAKAEDYDFSKIKVNDSVPDEAVIKAFSPAAHKLGLSKSQAQGVMDWLVGLGDQELKSMNAELDSQQKSAKASLMTEYGNAYNEKIDVAKAAAQWAGGPELVKAFVSEGWANNPVILRALVKIGKGIAEDVLSPAVRGASGALTPQQAQKRIAELQTDPGYFDRTKPTHTAIIQEISELTASAYPDGAGKAVVERMGFGK